MSLYIADLGTPGLTDVGYVWKNSAGADIGARTTTGVSEGEVGIYLADITPAAGAQGIFWDSAAEDTDAFAFGGVRPENFEVLGIESDGDLTQVDSLAGLSAGGVTTLDGADQILALELVPTTVVPVVVIPAPAADETLCTVYIYTEGIDNTTRAGIVIKFTLQSTSASGGSKSERVLEIAAEKTMTTDADGYASIELQRTDLLSPALSTYLVNCVALGLEDVSLTTGAATVNLGDIIT
jgi:hypothetical protein